MIDKEDEKEDEDGDEDEDTVAWSTCRNQATIMSSSNAAAGGLGDDAGDEDKAGPPTPGAALLSCVPE